MIGEIKPSSRDGEYVYSERIYDGSILLGYTATLCVDSRATVPENSDLTVVDGDTVQSGYRLVGFDTPERGGRARCPRERELAEVASSRMRDLIASSKPQLERVDCACKPGTEGSRSCNFGQAWRVFSAKRNEADYQAWRDQRDWTARKYAMRERGELMPSQKPNSMMRCPCGTTFDNHKLEHSLLHVPHITAANGTIQCQ